MQGPLKKVKIFQLFTEYDKFNIGMQPDQNYAANILFPLLNSRKFDSKFEMQKWFKL